MRSFPFFTRLNASVSLGYLFMFPFASANRLERLVTLEIDYRTQKNSCKSGKTYFTRYIIGKRICASTLMIEGARGKKSINYRMVFHFNSLWNRNLSVWNVVFLENVIYCVTKQRLRRALSIRLRL